LTATLLAYKQAVMLWQSVNKEVVKVKAKEKVNQLKKQLALAKT
jgi:hypothetical protein